MISTRVVRIVEAMAAGALVATAALVAFGTVPGSRDWTAAVFFTAFGFLASVLGYRRSTGTSGTISFLPFLSIAMLAPNVAALVTVFVSILLSEMVARRALIKALFNVAQYVLAEALAVLSFLALGGRSLFDGRPSVISFVALFVVFTAINKFAVSLVVSASTSGSARQHWMMSVRDSAVYDVLSLPLIIFFAFAYVQVGPLWAATFVLPMLGIRQLYKNIFALQKINEELLQLMVAAIEARDPYTSGHSQRVARFARIIARHAGLSGRVVERAVVAALLHDVGKIYEEFAPILRKPGRLTDEEFAVMKSHSLKSANLVSKVSHFEDLVPAIRSHHEAWDGSGYPDKLRAAEIPLGARVIALADTIDAMSTSRPYRAAIPSDLVREELRTQAGRQFDPEICRALLMPSSWTEMVREIEIATREFPTEQFSSEPLLAGRTGEYQAAPSR